MKQFKFKVTPIVKSEYLLTQEKCLYGVSVGDKSKDYSDTLNGYLWAQKKFKNCSMLLGDSLCRFTMQIQENIRIDESTDMAIKRGRHILQQAYNFFGSDFHFIRCSDVMNFDDFNQYHISVKDAFESNVLFSESIREDAIFFVERQFRQGRLAIPIVAAERLAVAYLLEEVAIYECLAQRGWLVDIYLGDELPTLKKIILGQIHVANTALADRINVSIRIR